MGEQQIDWHPILSGNRIGSVATCLDYANRFIARSVSDSRCVVLATDCGWLCYTAVPFALSLSLCLVWLSLVLFQCCRFVVAWARLIYSPISLLTCLYGVSLARQCRRRASLSLPLSLSPSLARSHSLLRCECLCDLNSNSKRIAVLPELPMQTRLYSCVLQIVGYISSLQCFVTCS